MKKKIHNSSLLSLEALVEVVTIILINCYYYFEMNGPYHIHDSSQLHLDSHFNIFHRV